MSLILPAVEPGNGDTEIGTLQEFRDPARDLPRATVLAVGLVTAIYLGVAFAVVATGIYGSDQLDRGPAPGPGRPGACDSRA